MLKKVIDLILYGNFWIACCALALCFQMQLILNIPLTLDVLVFFAFFATLFLYAAHRIVGISKLHEYFQVERYGVISTFKQHIRIYAAIGLIGSLVCFFYLSRSVQLALLIPAIVSLAYVIPFLGTNRRLRDVNHVKIFMVAIVWAWVTVLLPALEYGMFFDKNLMAMLVERALFIFAITLPFDIRDLKVDAHSDVKTIPAQIGVSNTKHLGAACLVIAFLIAFFLFQNGVYPQAVLIGLLLSYLSTTILVYLSDPKRHDYFYSGLMDGTMVFQFLFVWLCYQVM